MNGHGDKTASPLLRAVAFTGFVLLVAALAWWASGQAGGSGRAKPAGGAPATVSGPLPKLVVFGEGGCLACMLPKGLLAELAAAHPGRLLLDYVNVRSERKRAERCGVRNVPAQIGYDASGRELFRHEGELAAAAVTAKFKAAGVDLDARPSAKKP